MNKELATLVVEEATNLRKHASPEEKEKLNLGEIRNWSTKNCVYGLLTGDCYNKRSEQLIKSCCSRVYVRPQDSELCIYESILNGSPLEIPERISKEHDVVFYHSPIEVMLDYEAGDLEYRRVDGNMDRLLKYIKGETDTLELIGID